MPNYILIGSPMNIGNLSKQKSANFFLPIQGQSSIYSILAFFHIPTSRNDRQLRKTLVQDSNTRTVNFQYITLGNNIMPNVSRVAKPVSASRVWNNVKCQPPTSVLIITCVNYPRVLLTPMSPRWRSRIGVHWLGGGTGGGEGGHAPTSPSPSHQPTSHPWSTLWPPATASQDRTASEWVVWRWLCTYVFLLHNNPRVKTLFNIWLCWKDAFAY